MTRFQISVLCQYLSFPRKNNQGSKEETLRLDLSIVCIIGQELCTSTGWHLVVFPRHSGFKSLPFCCNYRIIVCWKSSLKKVQQWRKACRDVKACKEREWTFGMREWFSYHLIIWLCFFIYNRNRVAIFDQQYTIPSQPIQTWQVACSLTLYLQTTI